mmetsp:Transcript_97387/g.275342  ORF Transcript_97387/g.275342 Transcript_97387/m.275342 type:complete len:261 (+) Transcript_97387:71-853(+)
MVQQENTAEGEGRFVRKSRLRAKRPSSNVLPRRADTERRPCNNTGTRLRPPSHNISEGPQSLWPTPMRILGRRRRHMGLKHCWAIPALVRQVGARALLHRGRPPSNHQSQAPSIKRSAMRDVAFGGHPRLPRKDAMKQPSIKEQHPALARRHQKSVRRVALSELLIKHHSGAEGAAARFGQIDHATDGRVARHRARSRGMLVRVEVQSVALPLVGRFTVHPPLGAVGRGGLREVLRHEGPQVQNQLLHEVPCKRIERKGV